MEAGYLDLRLTHGYVGTYQHLDKWMELGQFQVEADRIIECDDEEDHCQTHQRVMFVTVNTFEPQPKERIGQALSDQFTSWGCAHEYDCCGCRSYYAVSEHIHRNLWRVDQTSSRNY